MAKEAEESTLQEVFSSKELVSASRQEALFQVTEWQRSRGIHFAGSVPRDW